MALSTALVFLALRHYSPQEMGVLAKVQAEVGMFSVLLTLCLDTPLLNRLSRPEDRGRLLGATLLLRAGALLLTMAAALSLAVMAGQSVEDTLPWLIIVLLPQAISALNVFGIMLLYSNHLGWVPNARLGVAIAFSGVRALALWHGWSLFSYTLLAALEGFIGLGLAWYAYRRRNYDIQITACFLTAKSLLKEAAPLILSSFIITCFFKLDLLLVSKLVPPTSLVEYSVAQRIVECYMAVIVILLNQHYIWLTSQRRAARRQGIAYMARVGYVLVAVVAVGHFFIAQPLLRQFLNGKYELGVELSGLLLLSLLMNVLGTVRGYLFVFERLNRWHVPSALMGISVLVLGTRGATTEYGLYGAATVLILGQLISVVFSSMVLRPVRGYVPILLGVSGQKCARRRPCRK